MRRIIALDFNLGYTLRVGREGVTRIEETEKQGQMAMTCWFNVYRGDEVWREVNAAQVSYIEYETPQYDRGRP